MPARVELAGGWSDTPPLCFLPHGGSVVNIALNIDGSPSFFARARLLQRPVIKCAELARGPRQAEGKCGWVVETEEEITSIESLLHISPQLPCSLHRACLLALGIIPRLQRRDISTASFDSLPPFQTLLAHFIYGTIAEQETLEMEQTGIELQVLTNRLQTMKASDVNTDSNTVRTLVANFLARWVRCFQRAQD